MAPVYQIKSIKGYRDKKLKNSVSKFLCRRFCVFCEFVLRIEFVNSLIAPVKADPWRAPFTALKYKTPS